MNPLTTPAQRVGVLFRLPICSYAHLPYARVAICPYAHMPYAHMTIWSGPYEHIYLVGHGLCHFR